MKNKNTFPKPITLKVCAKDYLENTKKERQCSERLKPYFENKYKKEYRSRQGLVKFFDECSQFPKVFVSGFTSARIYSIEGCSPTFTTYNDCHFWELKGRLTPLEKWSLEDADFKLLKYQMLLFIKYVEMELL